MIQKENGEVLAEGSVLYLASGYPQYKDFFQKFEPSKLVARSSMLWSTLIGLTSNGVGQGYDTRYYKEITQQDDQLTPQLQIGDVMFARPNTNHTDDTGWVVSPGEDGYPTLSEEEITVRAV
jgi:hypothetical protein